MIKQSDKDKAKKLGIDIDAIIAAHTDTKEVDITIPAGEVFTPDMLTARDTVKIKEGQKLGEKEAVNIAKVEIKKHAGIEVKGERWGDIGTEIKTAINSTGDEKLKQLQEQNALLLIDKSTLTSERDNAVKGLKTGMAELEIVGKIPAGTDVTARERFELAKLRGYTFEENEGVMAMKKGGEWVRDKTTQAILGIDKAVPVLIEEQKWTSQSAAPAGGGRGAQQKTLGGMAGAKPMNKTEAEAQWNESHPDKNIMSSEGMSWYAELAKEAGFNMYE